MPVATPMNAWKNAAPLDAQAASKRVAGMPVIPSAVEMYGARWFCAVNSGPAKLPR